MPFWHPVSMHVTEPVLWRRPGEVQVGVSAARILTGLEPTEIDLLLDLAVPRSAQWLARELTVRGIPSARWEKIRSSLPAPARSTPVRRGSVLLLDSHPLTVQVGHLLAERGVRVITESVGRSGRTRDRVPSRRPALAVLTDSWVTDPVRVGPLMRHDVTHLPIVVDDAVTVGPVVVPGGGACTRCLELSRTDADPAWPAVATQLRHLPGPLETELVLAAGLAAWVVADVLRDAPTSGWRITDGAVLPVTVECHPRCGCFTPPSAADRVPVSPG